MTSVQGLAVQLSKPLLRNFRSAKLRGTLKLQMEILNIPTILEYAPLIWSSNNLCITQNLEAVQNRFLRFLSFKFKVERPQQ